MHRQKDPTDRAIQTLKKDLAGIVARRGGGWGEHVDAAHQRRFEPEVADDLQVGGDAAVGVEGAPIRRAAHGELGDVRRGGVQGAGRRHRHVPIEADASVGEAGQQRAVFLADRYQGVLNLEVARCALQLGRLHEGGGGEAVDRQIGGGGDAAAVLQGGDAAVDGAVAVDGRHRAAERVEGRHQRVAAVALGLAPAVRLDLDDAAVGCRCPGWPPR